MELQPGTAPWHAIQSPKPLLDHVQQGLADGLRGRMAIGINQAQLLAENVVAQSVPRPAGKIVGELVEFEVVFQCAAIHVVLDHRVRHDAESIEQLTEIRTDAAGGASRKAAIPELERFHRLTLPAAEHTRAGGKSARIRRIVVAVTGIEVVARARRVVIAAGRGHVVLGLRIGG